MILNNKWTNILLPVDVVPLPPVGHGPYYNMSWCKDFTDEEMNLRDDSLTSRLYSPQTPKRETKDLLRFLTATAHVSFNQQEARGSKTLVSLNSFIFLFISFSKMSDSERKLFLQDFVGEKYESRQRRSQETVGWRLARRNPTLQTFLSLDVVYVLLPGPRHR